MPELAVLARQSRVAVAIRERDARYEELRDAFAAADIDWDVARAFRGGTGAVIVEPADMPAGLAADLSAGRPPPRLVSALQHLAVFSAAPLHVQIGLHIAEPMMRPKILAARLVTDSDLDAAVEGSGGVLALIVSDYFYRRVIAHNPAADPGSFRQISARTAVAERNTVQAVAHDGSVPAWLRVLPVPDLDDLDDTAQTLLHRATLLDEEEALDSDIAAVLLPDHDPVAVDRAMSALRDQGWMVLAIGEEGLVFPIQPPRSPGVPDSAEWRSRLRQYRIARGGVGPKTRLVRDYWTTEDLLGYRPYAEAIAAFIRHRDTRPPLTIGVKGPWGAGKTSLMRMVRAALDPPEGSDPRPVELTSSSRRALTRRRWWARADTPVSNGELLRQSTSPERADSLEVEPPERDWRATVWFNPWMYQSSEQVWAGLAYAIINQVTERLRPGDRERFWLELNLARVDRLAIRRRIYRLVLERLLPFAVTFVLALVVFGVLWLTGFARDPARWVLAVGTPALVAGGLISYVVFRAQRAVASFGHLLSGPAAGVFDTAVPDPGYAGRTGFLHAVHSDMTRVLKLVATEDQPLVVFVDDLDRCSPGVVAQVIEAINLFLAGEFENCVFVLATEPDVVAAHIEVAYAGLVDKLGTENGELGWRFLEKIVQLPLSLPAIDPQRHLPGYLSTLLGMPAAEEPPTTVPAAASPATTPPVQELGTSPTGPQLDRTHGGRSDRIVPQEKARPVVTSMPGETFVRQAEELIRRQNPTLESLTETVRQVAEHFRVDSGLADRNPPEHVQGLVLTAADRVFADLYSDSTAYDAIKAVLPALRSANPREVKRYVNLFRFYSFITFRARIHGTAPDDRQLAKLAALAIRWPDLLGTLGNSVILERMEKAADGDDQDWENLLTECGCLIAPGASARRTGLRDFLAQGPKIYNVAHGLL